MKKVTLVFLFFVFNLSFSQSDYKSAYYISKVGVKTQGYVKYSNLEDNDFFYFKNDLNGQEIQIPVNSITELKIENGDKYLSRMVNYDVDNAKEFSVTTYSSEPRLAEKQLLLNVLVEGSASLYVAKINDISFFYIKMDNSVSIDYLIYKKYTENNSQNENAKFRRQLFDKLNCGADYNYRKFYNVNYFDDELKKVINEYNICKNGKTVDLTKNQVKDKLKFAVVVGAKTQNFSISNEDFYGSIESKSYISPSFGMELSLVLPTKKRASEVFFRISFDKISYHSENQTPIPNSITTIYEKVNFKSNFLHFDLGPRYYFSGKSKNSLFMEAAFEYTILFSDEFTYSISSTPNAVAVKSVKTNPSFSFNVGVGYLFKNKYSIDFGYGFGSNYFEFVSKFDSKLSSLNLNLKYMF